MHSMRTIYFQMETQWTLHRISILTMMSQTHWNQSSPKEYYTKEDQERHAGSYQNVNNENECRELDF